MSPVLLTTGKDVAAVNRGAYFEVINVTVNGLLRGHLYQIGTSWLPIRIYIPDGSLIYLISEHESSPPLHHTVYGERRNRMRWNQSILLKKGSSNRPIRDHFGNDWYKVELVLVCFY